MDIPSLPTDSLHKFTFLFGLIFIGASFYFWRHEVSEYYDGNYRIDSLRVFGKYDTAKIVINEKKLYIYKKMLNDSIGDERRVFLLNQVDSISQQTLGIKSKIALRNIILKKKDRRIYYMLITMCFIIVVNIGIIYLILRSYNSWLSHQSIMDENYKMLTINTDLQNLKLERELGVFQDSRTDEEKGLKPIETSNSTTAEINNI